MRFFKDLSLSATVAGFVATLVGITSSIALVFQAAQALGATPAQTSSWIWAVGLGCGLGSMVPSMVLRQPVMVTWSVPGAAVIIAAGRGGFSMGEAVGAFLISAALVTLAGATGWFERVMNRIPVALASALLAGVLAHFGLAAFTAAQTALPLVLAMLLTYLLTRRFASRYAVPATLSVAIIFVAIHHQLHWAGATFGLVMPVFVAPRFSFGAAIGLALPIFVVTMASQNLPGVAAIRSAGYRMRVSPLIAMTGLLTLVLAPFGGYALNLSAITAAICMSRQAHENPARRYTAAACCGALYLLVGLFGGAVAGLLAAFPQELITAIAGLALLGSIGGGLAGAMSDETQREAALITFLVTLSGVTLAGIGSAFWGVAAGALALLVQHKGRRTPAA